MVATIVDTDNIEKAAGSADERRWTGSKTSLLDTNLGSHYPYANDDGETAHGTGVTKGAGEGLTEVTTEVCNKGGHPCESPDSRVCIDIKKPNWWASEKSTTLGVPDCSGLYCVVSTNLSGDVPKVVD